MPGTLHAWHYLLLTTPLCNCLCFIGRKVKFRESKQLASICSDEVCLCVISNLRNIYLLYN